MNGVHRSDDLESIDSSLPGVVPTLRTFVGLSLSARRRSRRCGKLDEQADRIYQKNGKTGHIPFGICRASETRFATNLDLVPLNRHGAQMLIKDLTGGGESFQSFVQALLRGLEAQQCGQGCITMEISRATL